MQQNKNLGIMIKINDFRIVHLKAHSCFHESYVVYRYDVRNFLTFPSLRKAIDFVTGWSNANPYRSRVTDPKLLVFDYD